MIDSLYIATNQISNLVNNINKKNFKQTVCEINQLLDLFKSDAEHHLFRVLFSVVDLSVTNDSKNVKDSYKYQLLISEINSRISKENFPSLICRAVDNPLSSQKALRPTNQLLPQLSKLLKLNKVHEVVMGLYLMQSTNKETSSFANQWVRQKLPDLLRSYVDGDNGGKEGGVFNDISMELLHLILSNLLNDKDKFGIGNEQLSAFCTALTKDFPKEGVPVVLSAVLDNLDDFVSEKGLRNTTHVFNDVNYLANLLEEMGPMTTQNIEELKAILSEFDSKLITSPVIAKCVCMFIRTSDNMKKPINTPDVLSEWNLDNFFATIFDKNQSINKRNIIEELDCKEFDASSKNALKILQNCIIHCVDAFPTDFFYSPWKNSLAQFSFLKSCFHNQDVIFLTKWAHRVCDLSILNINVDDEQLENQMSYWKNLDYIEALLRLSDMKLLREVRELFDIPMAKYPTIFVCSLMQSTIVSELRSRLLLKLFTIFVTNTAVPTSFFKMSWKNIDCRPLILSAFFDYYKDSENNIKNLSCVFRIADLIKEVNAVQFILPNSSNTLYSNIFRANSTHFRYEVVHFALDIVIYCTQKNTEFLSQWVSELLLKEVGQVLNFKALVNYVHLRYPKVIDNEDSKFLVPRELILDAQCLFEFLRNLDQTGKVHFQSDASIKSDLQAINQMMNKLTMIITQTGSSGPGPNQPLANLTPKVSRNKLDPTRSAFVPQSKMNRAELCPVLDPRFVDAARQSEYSQGPGAQDIKLQIQNELASVPSSTSAAAMASSATTSKYVSQARPVFPLPCDDSLPVMTIEQEIEKNLKLLFEGSISLQAMVDLYCNPTKSKREHLWSLIKVLVEELHYIYQYPDKQGKIYSDLFIQILSLDNNLITKQDIGKLYDSLVSTHSSLNNNNNNGREIVERIINFVNQSKKLPTIESATVEGQTSLASLNNVIAPSMFGNMDSPPENVTEKVFFIINNVSKMNVQEKATLLSEVVTQEYVIWFAQYIVMKRVTTEANFHDLFIQLIDCMADQLNGLKEKVLTETYRNIKILLFNMKVDLSDFNDRQLLKNLGKFLGMITLAKNKPILHDDMNLKDLLYEAFNMGHIELHYVVPFVTKTLEAAKDSIVFRPPCPWTMAIMKVLKELHEVETVKLNLKFEVEILCRNLKLDFNKLTAAFFLNDQTVRIETSLCRIVPSSSLMASQIPPSSNATAQEIIHNEVLNLRNNFERSLENHGASGHPGTRVIGQVAQQQQQQQQQQQRQQQQQNLETLESNRSSLIRPQMTYQQQQQQQMQQSMSVNNLGPPPGSVALQNYQNAAMRAGGNQDVAQYYSTATNGQSQYPSGVGGPSSNQMSVSGMDHGHSIRSLNIPYEELNTSNIANYLNIEDIPAPILNQIPNLKNQLMATMERVVFELITPLFDRCAKITIGTVDQLVVKDFGTDCDINTIKQYAFGMCRNLTAGLCLVTAREIVGVNLNTAVKQTILGEYRHVNIQDKEQVENFANKIVSTNNEICVAYLQKVVSEKTISELEKKLNNIIVPDSQKRNQFKPSAQELQVYECFSRNIPGFPSMVNATMSSGVPGTWSNTSLMQQQQQQRSVPRQYNTVTGVTGGSVVGGGAGGPVNVGNPENTLGENPLSRMISEIERQMNSISSITRNEQIIRSLRQIVDIAYLALQNKDPSLIHRLMRETVASFMTMYHSQILRDCSQGLEIMERLKEAHMYSLRIMQPYEDSGSGGGGYMSVNKQVTQAWTSMDEPKMVRQNGPGKWNGEAFSELLKTHVISLPAMDMFLAKKILDNNLSALIFVLDLLKYFVTGDKREFTVLNEFDLSATIDAINCQLVQQQQSVGPGKMQPDVAKLLAANMAKIGQLMDLGTLEKTVSSIYLYNGISLSREFDDPPTMPERSEIMIRLWMEHYCSAQQRDPGHIAAIVGNMNHNQLIHNDESFVRFLRLATVYVVERAHKQLKQDCSLVTSVNAGNVGVSSGPGGGPSVLPGSTMQVVMGPSGASRSASYTEIDAYAMLVSAMVLRPQDLQNRTCLLNKSLGIIAGTLLQEHEVRRDLFHPMPFQRIIIMLFNELQTALDDDGATGGGLDWQLQVLTAFTHTLHVIRPRCAPSFVFSWLELVSHRSFVGRMLAPTHPAMEQTHGMYCQLLADLYSFLRPYLENLYVPRPVQLIYRGTVSLTCLIMHDFPDLLIHYHSLLCNLLPVNCYQLRNIILCTTPKNIKLPDVTRPLHVEQLSQIEDPAGYCQYAGNRIQPVDLRQELDSYLASRLPVKFLSELINGLKRKLIDQGGSSGGQGTAGGNQGGASGGNSGGGGTSGAAASNISVISAKDVSTLINVPEDNIGRSAYYFKSNGVVHYDVDLMNNLVLYLCITATRVLRDKNIPLNINTIAHTAQMDIIQSLVLNLDNEGRFLLLNCMANQLRYPNSHSYYFIYTFLYLFAEQPQESVKEQITRVILERIIVNRPHPWGLLHLMNELFKNPSFWNHKFLRCSEEVEKILESVVKGCRGTVPPAVLATQCQPMDDLGNNSSAVITAES